MAKNVWNALSYLIPGLRGWRFASNFFNGKSVVDNDAKGLLSDIGQGLSDTFFGTTYNQQALQEDAQQYNAAQAQLSRDWQEEMYRRYESPAAMMQQFRDAGLNPALMYGGVSPSPSFGSDMASIGTPSAQHGNISLSDALLGAQIQNINANTEKTRAEAETENELRVSRKRNLDAATENLFKQNEDIVSRIEQRVHQNSLTDAEVFNISFEQMFKREQISIDWKRLENETNLTEAQIEKLKADREFALAQAKVTEREYDEMVYTFAIRALGLESKVHLDISMSKQAEATAKKLGLESMMIEPQALIRGSASDALKGKAGVVPNVGSFVLYSIYDVIANVGRLIH